MLPAFDAQEAISDAKQSVCVLLIPHGYAGGAGHLPYRRDETGLATIGSWSLHRPSTMPGVRPRS